MTLSPIPEGYHTGTSYLIVDDADAAIAYYSKAFGAKETMRLKMPDGSVAHAEFCIGDTIFMIGNASPEMGFQSPTQVGGTPVQTMLYVQDVDAVFQQALKAGGTETTPVTDQFYGDRTGALTDPFGHRWTVASRIEEVSLEEAQSRFDEMMKGDS
ncbi:MAG: VOC family protein [Planctomycetota bacterium]